MARVKKNSPATEPVHMDRSGLTGWLLALIPLAIFGWLLSLQPAIAAGQIIQGQWTWAPSLGISFSYGIDGLSLLFGLLISGIGALVFVYAGGYLAGDRELNRFYAYLMLFMGSMLGVVFSRNLLMLFIFWELTSITSYLLIGYKHAYADSRAAALQALLVTGGGGLALLVGILLLGQAGGSLEIGVLTARSQEIQANSLYVPIVLLVLVGAFTKSAQFPFHFWLPNAMAAPAPVSAYLHSATMVKAGVFLVALMTPVLGGTTLWAGLLTAFGGVTMVMGAFVAWRQTDLKRILAYTTVSALGMLTFLLGIGTPVAFKAAMTFLLAHALYKGALFMVAGAVDHQTGMRDIHRLGGLGRAMPVTAVAAVLAGLSMSGLPPLIGFVSKELFYEATLYSPSLNAILTGLALLANVLTVVAAGLVVIRPFFGRRPEELARPREAGVRLLLGPAVLGAAGLLFGLMIGTIGTSLIGPAVSSVAGTPVTVKLSLWHGLNPMLALSAATIGLALLVWFSQRWLLALTAPLDVGQRLGPERGYAGLLAGLPRFAVWQTRLIQHGYLRGYLLTIVLVMTGLVGLTLLTQAGLPTIAPLDELLSGVAFYEIAIVVLMVAATVAAATVASRLVAVVALGVVGLGMTLLFALFSAPDLAMTQFAVETLTVLLFVFVLYRLPRFQQLTSRRGRMRDLVAALLAGAAMTLLALTAVQAPHPMHVSTYFAEESWTGANGRNVVNVILVDFRALDTLGEIVVLTAAALGVHALVRPLLADRQAVKDGSLSSIDEQVDRSVILQTSTRYLLPLLLLLALFLLLRGHNEPGGGFVGGLVAASAIALYALSAGVAEARRLVRVDLRTLMAVGLTLAVGAGLLAFFAGDPLLTGLWLSWPVPVVGKLGTPLLFDVGVFLVVVGVTLKILFTLMETPDVTEPSKSENGA